MFKFANPSYLWLLLVVAMLLFLRLYMWKKKREQLRVLGELRLVKLLMPSVSNRRMFAKFILTTGALVFLIVAIARPQMGSKISKEKRNGIETVVALDISNSMLAEDVAPSRLEKSKLLVENLVDHFYNDKVGLVVFAGDAFVQLPLTTDFISAKMFLKSVNPSLIQTQGTDLAKAINLAVNSFDDNSQIGKAIIVITDGENHEGNAAEAAALARKKGINIFILGVGSDTGAPIPDGAGGYMRDRNGETVVTRLNEEMCQEIAQKGNGKYIHVNNVGGAQEVLNEELTKLQKGETESVVYSEYSDQYPTFCLIALLLLIAEVSVLGIKNPSLAKFNIMQMRRR